MKILNQCLFRASDRYFIGAALTNCRVIYYDGAKNVDKYAGMSSAEQLLERGTDKTADKIALLDPEKDADKIEDIIVKAYETLYNESMRAAEAEAKFRSKTIEKARDLQKKYRTDSAKALLDKYPGSVPHPGHVPPEQAIIHHGVAKDNKVVTRRSEFPVLGRLFGEDVAEIGEVNKRAMEVTRKEKDVITKEEELAALEEELKDYTPEKQLAELVAQVSHNVAPAVLKDVTDEYKAKKEKRKELLKKIGVDKEELAKEKVLLEKQMNAIQKMREEGEKLFNALYGARVQSLLKRRDTLDTDAFDDELAKLRMEVIASGGKLGITNFSYFLHKAVDDLPAHQDTPDYTAPMGALEVSREQATVGKWWNDTFEPKNETGKLDGQEEAFIKALRLEHPASLTAIREGSLDPNVVTVLKFLFKGELKGKTVLSNDRRLSLEPELVAQAIRNAHKYVAAASDFETHLDTFAKEWKNFKTTDLDYLFYLVQNGVKLPGKPKAPDTASKYSGDIIKDYLEKSFGLSPAPTGGTGISKDLYDKVFKDVNSYDGIFKDVLDDGDLSLGKKLKFFTQALKTNGDDLSSRFERIPTDKPEGMIQVLQKIKSLHRMDEATFDDAIDAYLDEVNPPGKKNNKKAKTADFLKYLEKHYS